MLNSPLSRSSQSSPNWHYAEPSPRISYLSRRRQSSNSNSNSKSQSPRPRVTNYVDVGIQCTLLQGPEVKLEREMAEKMSQTEKPVMAAASVVSGPLPVAQPLLDTESPTMKRRQSRATADEESSVAGGSQETRPKRARSASRPVKILPAKYEHCEVEDMVILIANMISELIETNDALPPRTGSLTRFHSRTPPGISVKDYLQRLAKHATLTPPLLLSMVYYIDRLCLLYPAFSITTLTVHRFLITAATVAAKGLSDLFWNNATYARVGGVKLAELGLLELDFLYRVDWKIVPNPETLVDYYRALVDRCDGYGLESEGLSDEDDMDDRSSAQSLEDLKNGASDTKEKWKAWMADVSMQSAEKGEYQEAKEKLFKKPQNAPP